MTTRTKPIPTQAANQTSAEAYALGSDAYRLGIEICPYHKGHELASEWWSGWRFARDMACAGTLPTASAASKVERSSTGAADVPKKRKQLTRKESKTEQGKFAMHLESMLAARGWEPSTFAEHLAAAGLGHIKEHAVRAWLRAENMPKTHDLRAIGRVLGLDDSRHVLPPD